MKLKATHCWIDKSFTELLELLDVMLPEGKCLSINTYEAKQIICKVSISRNTSVTVSFLGTVANTHSQHRVDHKVIQTSTSMPHTAII